MQMLCALGLGLEVDELDPTRPHGVHLGVCGWRQSRHGLSPHWGLESIRMNAGISGRHAAAGLVINGRSVGSRPCEPPRHGSLELDFNGEAEERPTRTITPSVTNVT